MEVLPYLANPTTPARVETTAAGEAVLPAADVRPRGEVSSKRDCAADRPLGHPSTTQAPRARAAAPQGCHRSHERPGRSAVAFPKDFQTPTDAGGAGAGQPIHGFGGLPGANREQNRRAIVRTPVILVHGNGGSATHASYGMLPVRAHLEKAGYNDAEIWALSYLGPNGATDMNNAHQNNIDDLRQFIARVMDYLGVDKVDIIAHSLGCTLTRSWLRGLSHDPAKVRWDEAPHYDQVGTFVELAAANHGLNATYAEWDPKGVFITGLNAGDESPHGAGDPQLPGGGNVTYVAMVAKGDFVDNQNPGTGRLQGADLNRDYDLGPGMPGHLAIRDNAKVFADYLPLLNRVPPRRRDEPARDG